MAEPNEDFILALTDCKSLDEINVRFLTKVEYFHSI